MRFPQNKFIYLILLSFLLFPPLTKALEFTQSSYTSQTGYQHIQWDADHETMPVIVEMALNASFDEPRILYAGKNRSAFISGLHNGNYFLRIKPAGGNWSSQTTLEVQHHSMSKAIYLFLIGLFVFALTVLVIIREACNES